MQHKITESKSLLRPGGVLSEAGYATSLILNYDRKQIKANKFRIKEWDYYLIANDQFAVALTTADNSYMGLDSVSLIDFKKPWQVTKSPMKLFPMGRNQMPSSSERGDVKSASKDHLIYFKREANRRLLKFHMSDFHNGHSISGEFVLADHNGDSMVIATPFKEDPLAFYYNQKINCLPAEGQVKLGDKVYLFKPDESYGVLDWGRGVWTYNNTWYWGSASGQLEGVPFGFNIGYGFGDTSAATENMLFYNYKAHKLSQVKFHIPMKGGKEDYLKQWYFTSDDNRFKMIFKPVIDRAACTDMGILCSDQHQVFGYFTGRAVLDDGTVLKIKNLLGFAEKVHNKW